MVVLPAPLVPMRVTTSPALDAEGDALDGLDLAVGDPEVLDLEQCGHRSFSLPAVPVVPVGRFDFALFLARAPSRVAEVGGDDAFVALDLARRAFDELLALDEAGDAVAEVEDEPHVVLDDEDGDARCPGWRRSVLRSARVSCGFMPAVGSSRRSRRGSLARARAISSLRWSP